MAIVYFATKHVVCFGKILSKSIHICYRFTFYSECRNSVHAF